MPRRGNAERDHVNLNGADNAHLGHAQSATSDRDILALCLRGRRPDLCEQSSAASETSRGWPFRARARDKGSSAAKLEHRHRFVDHDSYRCKPVQEHAVGFLLNIEAFQIGAFSSRPLGRIWLPDVTTN